MLVDHFIKPDTCDPRVHSHQYNDNDISMSQFIDHRHYLAFKAPDIAKPDFALDERLPDEAKIGVDENGDFESTGDTWKKHIKDPLSHLTPKQWNQQWEVMQELFTGGETEPKLEVGMEDISTSESYVKRNIAAGTVTIDIDSILALFTDLSTIASTINICVTSNPNKNLKTGIHLSHKGAPLHHIPHFYFGSFGHDPTYDIFVFLPQLYDSDLKRTKFNLRNHVPEDVRSEFMNKCLFPAVQEVLSPNESQGWDFLYEVVNAKSTASAKEGNKYKVPEFKVFHQEIRSDLDKRHIRQMWNICDRKLAHEVQKGSTLKAFRGYQFLVNAKGYKYRLKANEFPELMKIYKNQVLSNKNLTDFRLKKASTFIRLIFIGFTWISE